MFSAQSTGTVAALSSISTSISIHLYVYVLSETYVYSPYIQICILLLIIFFYFSDGNSPRRALILLRDFRQLGVVFGMLPYLSNR